MLLTRKVPRSRTGRLKTIWFAFCPISINQNSEREKAQQVKLMPHIFREATCVMAMLGSGTQFDDAIKMLWRVDTSAPNDDRQQEAEDLMHEVYRIILNNELYEAPIGDNPQRVLDLGCGTGIWAIEFADLHPSADVLGVDLSPIQPTFVPPNCRFEVDDINQEWTHPDNHFDFVHIRAMMGCIPDWPELFEKAFKHTLPGGWIESVELWGAAKCDDDTLKSDSPLYTWIDIFKRIGSLTGKPFFWDDKMAESITKAGFINLTGRVIKVPIGTWPKDKTLKQWGAWNRQFLLQGLEGFSIRGLTEMLGWKYEDAQLFLANMRKELTDPAIHAYLNVDI
ncbi:hypothetical protein MRS44_017320 [Fusarium solani]|uniref:uncharacterized protein n=1 Tax=Fusarium solani TaxID=169388 RepID=UPI0032C437A2|nr:hypothetical protein MRS44_017320 [Fusarium solani]